MLHDAEADAETTCWQDSVTWHATLRIHAAGVNEIDTVYVLGQKKRGHESHDAAL